MGGDGDDLLIGGAGIDIYEGSDGDDFIDSSDGVLEVVRGGDGRDVFLGDAYDFLADFDPSWDTRY